MNASDYYKEEIFLARVDNDDRILGRIERWEAHETGILHRGFTAILVYDKQYLVQRRKHPAFDGVWDFTFSSHQIYKGNVLQSDTEAVAAALQREWNITTDVRCEMLGKVYYEAKDPKSIFTEHEVDYVFRVQITTLPRINTEYAYGYELVDAEPQAFAKAMKKYQLAPWAEKIVSTLGLHLDR